MRSRRALVAFSTLVAVIGPMLLSTAAPATADPIGSCSTSVGTIVAVDFAHWGGPIVRGCGVNDPSGYALLQAAGFTTAGDSHDGPAFICRLGDSAFNHGTQYPTPKQDPCIVTPPAAAYWSYWRAPAGQNTWSYSQVGAMSEVPKPGEVELWVFGGTNIAGTNGSGVPSFTPDSVRAQNTRAAGGTSPSPQPTKSASTLGTAATSPSSPQKSHAAAPPKSSTTTHRSTSKPAGSAKSTAAKTHPATASLSRTATTSPTATNSASTGTADSTPAIVDALPTTTHTSSGSAVPLIVGLALVLVIGGSAIVALRRRRRQEE